MQVIFLLSLPRSGSTLLQRILAAHSSVTTVSEPWLLLPLVYSAHPEGVYAEYGHRIAVQALQDIFHELPGGTAPYFNDVRSLYLSICERLNTKKGLYFLDKTPRYSLIAEDLIEIFPDAKFIVLWRDPLAVIASILDTWGHQRWNLHHFHIDLFKGLSRLVDFAERYKDRIHQVRYEDLVRTPETCVRDLLSYLDLAYDPSLITEHFTVNLQGRWGDTTRQDQALPISPNSLEKWTRSLSNFWRKQWALYYLRWIGRERLMTMGYDLTEKLSQVNQMQLGFKQFWSDLILIPFGWLYLFLEPTLLKEKWKTFVTSREVYKHI